MQMTKSRALTPRDRRFDRRMVAIAALAALLITAASAQANTVDFVANPALSSLKLTVTTKASNQPFWSALGLGTYSDQVSGPQYANKDLTLGNVTNYYGHLRADFTNAGPNGTIQLVQGGKLYAANLVNPISNTEQTFQPSEVLTGLPGPDNNARAVLNGTPQPANYALQLQRSNGFNVPNNIYQRIYGLELDAKAGNVPTNLNGAGNFSLVGNNLVITNGISDVDNAFTAYLDSVAGNPTATAIASALKSVTHRSMSLAAHPQYSSLTMTSSATGNWNGTTLTLQVHTSLLISGGASLSPANIVANMNGIPVLMQFDGTLVFNAYGGFGGPVPEPSTMTLLGFGVAGLLTYAYRARKRTALVA